MTVFGKHFASLYTGSMVGSGALTFAVWGYVIANMYPVGDALHVDLNPKLIGPILGEPVDEVRAIVEKFCEPDPESRSKEEDGRRLVRLGQFDFRVVNGPKYLAIRNEVDRKRQLREAQAVWRANHPKNGRPRRGRNAGKPLAGEMSAVREFERTGDETALD